jgi:sugar phosphate isomerase/epimerase
VTSDGGTRDVPTGRPARVPTPRPDDPRLARLSLNQWTTRRLGLPELVEACSLRGIPAVGLWREQVHEVGPARAAELVASAGLRVSSLCRAWGFSAPSGSAWTAAVDEARRAIDEAATLGAPVLAVVAGGLPPDDRDLAGARERVRDAIALLAPEAGAAGVRLGLEPLHPMYSADRSVVSTLDQALRMLEGIPVEQAGVVIDTFHVWWDPDIRAGIARASGAIVALQLADWITPLPPDPLLGRGMLGDGHIELDHLVRAVLDAGYRGDIEVEIFNQDVWDAPPHDVIDTVMRRYVEVIGHALS